MQASCVPPLVPIQSTLSMVDRIDALLPQTQCRRCGFDGCRPYAEAIASGAAGPNRCPPGGEATLERVGALLGVDGLALDESRGAPGEFPRARIVESLCIGCTLCLQACPVDAIVGAAKLMHTVIGNECTGCGLCLPPCPVDCIVLEPDPRLWAAEDADAARERHARRTRRLHAAREERIEARSATRVPSSEAVDREARRAAVAAALDRARSRRAMQP